MPMSEEAIAAGKIHEPDILVSAIAAGAANRLTNHSLTNKWKGRVFRFIATNKDNAVRTLTIYSGIAATRNQTLVKEIQLSNYETRIFEVMHPEKDEIMKWGIVTDGEDTDLYAWLDAVTTGVLVESLEWIPERA